MSTERMIKARVGLLVTQPFFGTLALRLELVEDPKCKTTWTDGSRLGFNPEWATHCPMPQLEAAFAHQVFSCAMGHHLRRGDREGKSWNDASDYAVNAELQRAGFTLPDGSLVDSQYDGLHTEAIYSAIKRKAEDQGKGNQPPAPGGDEQGGGASGSPQRGDKPGKGKTDQSPQSAPPPPQTPGQGDEATGTLCDATDDQGQQIDPAEAEAQQEDWQVAVAQAAQIARGAGKLPGAIERKMQEMLEPVVAWQEALERYFASKSKDDLNWSKPNTRYLHLDLYLPSLESVAAGAYAFAFDMSGSITQQVVDQFCAELEGMRVKVKPTKIVVMCFNTVVTQVLEFGPDDPIVIKAKGGGGTAFDDPVRTLEELEIEPEALIYLTDLDSSVFPTEPAYPVLWVSTKKNYAPFGEVIMMQ